MVGFFIDRVRGPWVVALNVAAFAYGWLMLQTLPQWRALGAAAGGNELQARVFYDPATAAQVLGGYDAALRQAAFTFYGLDLVNAALFALSVGALMAFGLRQVRWERSVARFVILAPLAAGAFDMLENAALAAALATGAGEAGPLHAAAGVLTALKMTATMVSLPLMLVLTLAGVAAWLWRRFKPTPGAGA
ncbi:hypothetical protein [Phenylobacterium sp.]|uniref:hypothetical protein n=1 Tax=Phenylobacterium sp. TaxID=1871053 RepID=UPI0027372784|nr:hypothetical protein [Phenylobacterium sp.]MDP3854913.1 hypothetical protein [Phenylobacterium sp.]